MDTKARLAFPDLDAAIHDVHFREYLNDRNGSLVKMLEFADVHVNSGDIATLNEFINNSPASKKGRHVFAYNLDELGVHIPEFKLYRQWLAARFPGMQ